MSLSRKALTIPRNVRVLAARLVAETIEGPVNADEITDMADGKWGPELSDAMASKTGMFLSIICSAGFQDSLAMHELPPWATN